jgi:hypothetical protein
MTAFPSIWQTIGRGTAHPNEVLNLLIELDNRRGMLGLWDLENELRAGLPKLRPNSQAMATAWLEAVQEYRAAYYPEGNLIKLMRLAGLELS